MTTYFIFCESSYMLIYLFNNAFCIVYRKSHQIEMRIWMRILTIDSNPKIDYSYIFYIYRSWDLVILLAWTNCCRDQQWPQFVIFFFWSYKPHMMGWDRRLCMLAWTRPQSWGNSLQDRERKNLIWFCVSKSIPGC
jgi:hypothetical protein